MGHIKRTCTIERKPSVVLYTSPRDRNSLSPWTSMFPLSEPLRLSRSACMTPRKNVQTHTRTHTTETRTPTERPSTTIDQHYNAEQIRENVFGEVGGATRPRHPEGEDLDGSESPARLHHKRTSTSCMIHQNRRSIFFFEVAH